MSLETLLMVVAVVVAGAFNVIMAWIRKRQEEAAVGNAEPERQEAPTAVLTPVPAASPVPAAPVQAASPAPTPEFGTRRQAPTRITASMAPAAARPARRSPVGSLSGMRNGIVLAAVLGPCRAQTPFV